MQKLICILLLTLSFYGHAQDFAPKKFYLVDSLVLSELSNQDTALIKESLTKYHNAKHDTDKINALGIICEQMMHHDWIKYQFLQKELIELSLAKTPNEKTHKALLIAHASSLNNIGIYYNELGNINQSLSFFERSLAIQEEMKDKKGMVSTIQNIGNIYSHQGIVIKALEYFHRSLKIAEEIGDKSSVGNNLTNIGFIYSNQGDAKKALEYYEKSLTLKREVKDKHGTALALNNIGFMHAVRKDTTTALKYFEQSLALYDEIGHKHGVAQCLQNIGSIYKNYGDTDKAIDYLNRSIQISKEINNKKSIAAAKHIFGGIYFDQGKTEEAKKYAIESLKMSQELGFPDNIKNAASLLHRIYYKEKNGKKALKMYKLYITMRDSMSNLDTQKQSAKQQAKYEYEKQKVLDDATHEKQLAIEQEGKEKQQLITITTAAGLALVIIFLIFIFNRLQVTRKQKKIIEDQKILVEQQKNVVEVAHKELEIKNQEILDSITYAKRIQAAILPSEKIVKEYLPNSFILYKPKDIVAGDFYWMEHKDNKILFAAADCTGHGVPGAMVSVVCNNSLNRSVREHGLTDPGAILNKTREIVIEEFEKSDEEVKDGMDIALCSIDGSTLNYAGANNPLWIVRENNLIEIKADKQPIGKFENPLPYTTHTYKLQKNDTIYIFSDGYVDQFGGEKGKKFKINSFRDLLLSIHTKPMKDQKKVLYKAFKTWKGSLEQIDDICIIGVRI